MGIKMIEHTVGRCKLTLLVLHALEEALDRWGTEMAGDQLPQIIYGMLVQRTKSRGEENSSEPGNLCLFCHILYFVTFIHDLPPVDALLPNGLPGDSVANRLKSAVVEGIADETVTRSSSTLR
jgi:hypothetical protein